MNENTQQTMEDAVGRAEAILGKRLERGGIQTDNCHWYYQCEGGSIKGYDGGRQVRVKTWRHWSDADVFIDVDREEVVFRCIDRLSEPECAAELDEAEAERIIRSAVEIPDDAKPRKFSHEYFAPGCKLARLEWERRRDGLRVDGDYIWATVHPQTHEIVGFGRKWG